MPGFEILRWLVRRALSSPFAWIVTLGLIFLPLALRALGPLGWDGHGTGEHGFFYDLAFVSALLGAGFGVHAADDLRRAAPRLGSLRRWSLEALVLVACIVFPLLLAALPTLTRSVDPMRLAVISMWMIALGLVLLRVPFPSGIRPIAVALLAWIVPALVPEKGAAARGVLALIDVGRFSALETTGPLAVAAPASILALLLTAIGLDLCRRTSS